MLRAFSILFCLLVAAPAHASPFTWEIAGTFGTGFSPGLFTPGDSFLWTLHMDSDSPEYPDYVPDPSCGVYAPIRSMSLTTGSGQSFVRNTTPGQDYIVSTGGGTCDIPGGLVRIRTDFGTDFALTLHLFRFNATDALFTSPYGITGSSLEFFPFGLDEPRVIVGRVSSIREVSEPSTVGLAMVGLGFVRRRRRSGAPVHWFIGFMRFTGSGSGGSVQSSRECSRFGGNGGKSISLLAANPSDS